MALLVFTEKPHKKNNLKLKQSSNSSDILVSFFFHVHLLFFYNKPVSNKIKMHIKMFLYNGFSQKQGKSKSGIRLSLYHILKTIFSLSQNLEGENIGNNKVSYCTIKNHLQLTPICHVLLELLNAFTVCLLHLIIVISCLSEDFTVRGPQMTVLIKVQ